MKLNLKYLLYLPILLFFFPAFAFYLPGIGMCTFFIFSIYLTLIILFIFEHKKLINKMIYLSKTTPLKYFFLVTVLVIINGFIVSGLGISNIMTTLKYTLMRIILVILPVVIYFTYMIQKHITYKKFIKFFVFMYWLVLIIGFFAYFGQLFDIGPINKLFDTLANSRVIANSLGLGHTTVFDQASNYVAFGLPRLDNLMEEPSFYARYLYLFMPLCYACYENKFKVFENKQLNTTIKYTIIPFTWISMILTFSPIYLIFGVLITAIYYFKTILIWIKKFFIPIILAIFITGFYLSKIDLSETYLSRIVNVLTNIKSFDDFANIEQSLATRICSYVNCLCVFIKHIFTGVGIGNLNHALFYQYPNSPLSLTPEIIARNAMLAAQHRAFYNKSFIYAFLAENGIIIFGIFVYFYYRLFKMVSVIYKKYRIEPNFYTFWLKGLLYTSVASIIGSFYSSSLLSTDIYLNISLLTITIYHYTGIRKITYVGNIQKN